MRHFLRFISLVICAFFMKLSVTGQPTITNISPTSGPVGTQVTIYGTNFNTTPSANTVYFGNVLASVTAAAATELYVTVPPGAGYLPITVTTGGLTAYATKRFSITFPGGGSVFTNSSFAAKIDFNTGLHPYAIAMGDIDGDGRQDVLTTNYDAGNFSVLRNTSTPGAVSVAGTSNFATLQPTPYGIAVGDIDGDGRLDVVVTSSTTKMVSAFRNISSPGVVNFEAVYNYSLGAADNYPTSVVICDINKDGKPDILTTCSGTNKIAVFKNTGAGGSFSATTFAAPVTFSTGITPQGIAIADIDNDLTPDIIVCNRSSGTISTYRNTSTPSTLTITPAGSFATLANVFGLAVGDLDADGRMDIAVAGDGTAPGVSLLRNTTTSSTFSFAPKQEFTVPAASSCRHVSIADIDGDTRLDVAFTNNSGVVSALHNITIVPGSFYFDTRKDYSTGSNPGGIAMADLDGDGKPEMAVAATDGSFVSVFRNQVANPIVTSFTPTQARAGETVTITGTGLAGATAVSFGGTPAAAVTPVDATTVIAELAEGNSGVLSVTTPMGTSTALPGFTFLPGPLINSFSPGSGVLGQTVTIGGKGFSATAANNTVYFGAVKATVQAATTKQLTLSAPAGTSPQFITVTKNNLTAYTGSPFTVTFPGDNISTSSFAAKADIFLPPISATPATPYDVASGDLDGDGQPDLVTVNNGHNKISVLRNTSTSSAISFAPKLDWAVSNSPRKVALSDIDGDGKLDILVVNYISGDITILKNTSTTGYLSFTTSTKTIGAGATKPVFIAIHDLDGDGKPDIIATAESGYISVLRNISATGVIDFASSATPSTGGVPTGIAIGDLDGDGLADVAVTCSTSKYIVVFRNTSTEGNITLIRIPDTYVNNNTTPYAIAIQDMDGDGKPDLVAIGSSPFGTNQLASFRNISTAGTISFDTRTDYTVAGFHNCIAVGDVNGDGKPDIITADNVNTSLSVLQNKSTTNTIAFGTPVVFTTPVSVYGVALSDLDLDGKLDMASVSVGENKVSIFKNKITNNPLPVTLISFTAKQVADAVLLDWATASEQNSDHFEIEKSTDAVSFHKIGEIKSAGDSYDRKDYAFTDQFPQSGINYYRLKQVDKDGKFKYSDIRTVNIAAGAAGDRLVIYPNPVKSATLLLKTSLADGRYEAVLLSAKGDRIQQQQVQVQGNQAKLVLISKPAPGIYLLQLNGQDNKASQQLVVQ